MIGLRKARARPFPTGSMMSRGIGRWSMWDQSRHGGICGGEYPAMVEAGRATWLSGGLPSVDLCGWGWEQYSRTRAWNANLLELAEETGIPITVSHYPPGTSQLSIGCFRLSV
jgi:Rhodopirellula transposase DDE domain